MKLPHMKPIRTSREMIDVFGGYNHNLRIGAGEFYDMKNLTSDHYPVLSSRHNRGIYATPIAEKGALGLISKDALCYVEGGDFIINGYHVQMGLSDEPKKLISMGSYVIIMPDKMYINTIENEEDGSFEYGKIEAEVITTESVHFDLCKIDGESYGDIPPSDKAPDDPQDGEMWLDVSSVPHTLKQYSATNATWVSIATTYIKISSPGIGMPFAEGDGVTISGIESSDLSDLNSTMVILARGEGYIVVTGILDQSITQENPIKVSRKMPEMDFIIESGNRLWGCRYGTDINGNIVNEIYASKLGDFKNWSSYEGISTDSYAASVGTDGQFTGAITHLGYPLFFKENCVHKVYGNYPANYQIQTTTCRGVQKGCSKSLAIVNEVLYYKSQSAICAYDGSLPAEISFDLGNISYSDAVAGSLGNKYYISMADTSKTNHLFVYDTVKGMWHKEDNVKVRDFCNCRGDLYYTEEGSGIIKAILGIDCKDKEDPNIEWMAETGIIGTDSPDRKYISRMDVRISMDIGSRVYIYAQYDSSDIWEQLHTMVAPKLQTIAIPVRPRRCDHLRLRIEGHGEAKIFSICKTISQGSDIL